MSSSPTLLTAAAAEAPPLEATAVDLRLAVVAFDLTEDAFELTRLPKATRDSDAEVAPVLGVFTVGGY
eukprot:CAMPEP_0170458958 /NCGR_PEP_ID=MMETSP0123-20130129/5779_2 /TAXON_ID=182087 /ORGANISM="Favella ehrenbergii, Strain Fehren 1" /LENGTH=67 /DNA_ID= /DNA_START= /DNA_END= /DNA_ORIENTATION=